MRKLALLATLAAASMSGQTAETIPFRAVLLPSNEVPAVPVNATGAGTVWVHIVRDTSGKVASASVDFNTNYQFPSAVRITGMHIHKGRAGENGPVTINSNISGADPVIDSTGRGVINRQGQVPEAASVTPALDTVNGMLADPSGFYLNVHTDEYPNGIIRGQLQRADMTVLMGQMSPANEVPAITGVNALGTAAVVALRTRDENGVVTSGQVIFDMNYTGFDEGTTFTGFHIHQSPAGVNGPVTINTGIGSGAASVPAAAAGGNLHYEVEVLPSNPASVQTLNSLFSDPGATYINAHTTVYPGGVIRAQLRRTDRMTFSVLMSPANEVPPIAGLNASAPAMVTVHTIRNANGSVAAGAVIFDVNYRFPGEITFSGLHIHNGKAGENGPVTIDTGTSARAPVTSATGQGNVYRVITVNSAAGLATLNSLVINPENHYINIHTPANPGGALRSQLSPVVTTAPSTSAVISAVSDPNLKTVARGGLMTIFGANLSKTTADVGSAFNGATLPSSFNGTQVTVGGKVAPILTLAPNYIVAQVPLDAALGSQPVIVTGANGASAALITTVAEAAPALFFDTEGAIATDFFYRLIRPSFPAGAGQNIWLYGTGFGLTNSTGTVPTALATGQITPFGALNVAMAPVRVTIGGRDATIVTSFLSPGYAGLYQIGVSVPAGLSPGMAPVIVRVGDAVSNTVMLPVR